MTIEKLASRTCNATTRYAATAPPGNGVELQPAGAAKMRGAVLAVDRQTRTVEGGSFVPTRATGSAPRSWRS